MKSLYNEALKWLTKDERNATIVHVKRTDLLDYQMYFERKLERDNMPHLLKKIEWREE